MSGQRLRIAAKAGLSSLPKNIIITGKGVARINGANGELYDRMPIEDYHNQNVQPSSNALESYEDSVDVFVGKTGEEKPEGLFGVFQVVVDGAGSPVVQVSEEGVSLWTLEHVETVRNKEV